MKTKIIILSVISLISLSFIIGQEEIDWNSYMKKSTSTWGKPCPECIYNNDIFQYSLRNVGNESVDVLLAIQEKDKSWRCSYHEKVMPNDTILGFACKGTGKVKKWVRRAGDRELEFPTCEQVNKEFRE